jgi:uncharacterized membrane protein SpoIIM required for sporulation
MVLESLIGEKNIRKNPALVLGLTMIISLVSIVIAYFVFPKYTSVLSISFITIGLVPLIHSVLRNEDFNERLKRKQASNFLQRNSTIIQFYVWIFIGVILAFTIAYVFCPVEIKQTVFEEQINSFCIISGSDNCVSGVPNSIKAMFSEFSGSSVDGLFSGAFNACQNPATSNLATCSLFIFENNFLVLFWTIVLSIFYGAGAIFILAWNASILGMFFGEMILTIQFARGIGLFQGMLIGHGPPELLGYIFGALAGGILSAMVSRKQFFTHEFSIVIKDFFLLAFLAVFSVVYGAIIEAMGIIGLTELYFFFGFVYVLLLMVILLVYGKVRK